MCCGNSTYKVVSTFSFYYWKVVCSLYSFFQHDMTWQLNVFCMSVLKDLFIVYFDHMTSAKE